MVLFNNTMVFFYYLKMCTARSECKGPRICEHVCTCTSVILSLDPADFFPENLDQHIAAYLSATLNEWLKNLSYVLQSLIVMRLQ